jgi:hypothetical protein
MLPVSHTCVSLYATSDNETHFRMVQVQLDLVEDFAVPAATSAELVYERLRVIFFCTLGG